MEGIVQSINNYKSGKGAFIRIANTDYMFFGNPSVKVGDKAIFELGKPSKDGKPTIRAIKPDGIEAFVDEDKPRSAPIGIHPAPHVKGCLDADKPVYYGHFCRFKDEPNNHPPQTSAVPSKDSRENYWANKEAADRAKEPVITMLSAISSACVLLKPTNLVGETISADKVIQYAEAFYAAAQKKRGDKV